MTAVLAFGGPVNGRLIDRRLVNGGRHRAAMPSELTARDFMAGPDHLIENESWRMRIVDYELVALGWTNSDGTHEVHDCLVAEGFPRDRITDGLNAIAALASLVWTVKAAA